MAAIMMKSLMAVCLAAGSLAMAMKDSAARPIASGEAAVMRGGALVASTCADATITTTDSCKDKSKDQTVIVTGTDGKQLSLTTRLTCPNATEQEQNCSPAQQANRKICQKEAKTCSGKQTEQVVSTTPPGVPTITNKDCTVTYTKATPVNLGPNDPACVVAAAGPQ